MKVQWREKRSSSSINCLQNPEPVRGVSHTIKKGNWAWGGGEQCDHSKPARQETRSRDVACTGQRVCAHQLVTHPERLAVPTGDWRLPVHLPPPPSAF